MAHPNLYLRETKFNSIAARLNLMALRRKLLQEYTDEPRTVRARLKLEARERNLLLIERLCLSSIENISLNKNGTATSLIQPGIGWSAEDLIPYFCVDWTECSAYHDVRGHILSAAAGCRKFGRAAVLGSGAGRLLADLANHFDAAIGIDLSLPALLLSRHLLTGGQLELSLERANWRAVTLIGSQQPPSNVRLAAADAAALPFANNSLTFVVTQYLLDIVPNPIRVARRW
jgi:Methyltransferase domain